MRVQIQLQIERRSHGRCWSITSRKYASSSVPEKILHHVARDACQIGLAPLPQIPTRQFVLPGMILKLRDGALIGLLDLRARAGSAPETPPARHISRIRGIAIDLAPIERQRVADRFSETSRAT